MKLTGQDFKVKIVDLDTGEHTVILNEKDTAILGLRSLDRVKVVAKEASITALVETTKSLVGQGFAGLSKDEMEELDLEQGENKVYIIPTQRPKSIEVIKKKMKGVELQKDEIQLIVKDIVERNLSDIELAAYVTANYINPMNLREIKDLTMAMVETGDIIEIDREPIFDFHSIGGVPGNKVTLLVVPIVAAAGLCIPKTCSRAISSAGGTADILETLCNVTLSAHQIKSISERIGGVIAWGGGVNIAPADDIIIRAEYPLAIDPYSQVIASVMAKKKAVGADYFLLDIPTGPGTKVEDFKLARRYARDFIELGEQLNMRVECAITYGGQPIGRSIGPAVEAKEALMALEGKTVSSSVIEKSTSLSGIILELAGVTTAGKKMAAELLNSGKALEKFREILEAQEGNPDIKSDAVPIGDKKVDFTAQREGYIAHIDNKCLVRIVRLAGAPHDKGAGMIIHKKKGHQVEKGEALFTIYGTNERKVNNALRLAQKRPPMLIEGMVIERVPSIHHIESKFDE